MRRTALFCVLVTMVSATAWAQQSRAAVAEPVVSSVETPTPASPPSDGRTFGLGIGGGGLSLGFGPSARYWMSDKVGVEVQASFYSRDVFGRKHNQTAISPSLLVRFGSDGNAGDIKFRPYFGGGLTLWSFSRGYSDAYNDSSVTLGAFVGGEAIFRKWPRFAASGSIGYYTTPESLGFGGLYTTIGFHYYFK